MAAVLFMVRYLVHLSDFWMMLLLLVVGVAVYFGYLALRGNGFFRETVDRIMQLIVKGRK